MDSLDLLLNELEAHPSVGPDKLRRLKNRVAKRLKAPLLRNDLILDRYRAQVAEGIRLRNPELERSLTLNAIRSASGIAAVTVLTKPYPCPGRCVFCPTESNTPKSYLPNEPPVMRALQTNYDPYLQVVSRLRALEATGHATGKIELIVKGGTWSFYPQEYQRRFIQRCFDAASGSSSGDLGQAQQINETAPHRIVGLTIETRPDYVTLEEIRRLRELGVTRVEMGVQSLEDKVLRTSVRDHTTREIVQATKLLRDAGFKVSFHLMPNLPGATPEDDLNTFRVLFENPDFRPDAIKVYPCVVVKSAELYRWWLEGRYKPYEEEILLKLIIQLKTLVPPYVRIERIVRDIASDRVEAGCTTNNLREEVLRRMRRQGLRCRCIRCREIREGTGGELVLIRRDYEAAGGKEIFLSFEDSVSDRLAALLRLRIPSATFLSRKVPQCGASSVFLKKPHEIPVLNQAALVRELHTYGRHISLQDRTSSAVQHRGLGKSLLQEAERIAREEFGITRLAVIAGVWVRGYYRRFGYTLKDSYMVKELL